jgi:hypothetical protein
MILRAVTLILGKKLLPDKLLAVDYHVSSPPIGYNAEMLQRLWTSIVAGVAGAAIGFVITVIMVQQRYPLDSALYAVWVFAALGFSAGFALGKPKPE